MSRLIGAKRSLIQSTGRADLGGLVQRLSVPPNSGTAQNIIVPSRAIWAVARAVGSGGNGVQLNYTNFYCGGGGAFAKSIFSVVPGETLYAVVNSAESYYPYWQSGYPGLASSLDQGGVTRLSAAGGGGATIGSGGVGGDSNNCIGTITRSGGAGGDPSTGTYAIPVASNPSDRYTYASMGGYAASDIGDLDATGIGGIGAGYAASGYVYAGPGGGAAFQFVGYNNDARVHGPGPGAMIIEFYDGQVPQ